MTHSEPRKIKQLDHMRVLTTCLAAIWAQDGPVVSHVAKNARDWDPPSIETGCNFSEGPITAKDERALGHCITTLLSRTGREVVSFTILKVNDSVLAVQSEIPSCFSVKNPDGCATSAATATPFPSQKDLDALVMFVVSEAKNWPISHTAKCTPEAVNTTTFELKAQKASNVGQLSPLFKFIPKPALFYESTAEIRTVLWKYAAQQSDHIVHCGVIQRLVSVIPHITDCYKKPVDVEKVLQHLWRMQAYVIASSLVTIRRRFTATYSKRLLAVMDGIKTHIPASPNLEAFERAQAVVFPTPPTPDRLDQDYGGLLWAVRVRTDMLFKRANPGPSGQSGQSRMASLAQKAQTRWEFLKSYGKPDAPPSGSQLLTDRFYVARNLLDRYLEQPSKLFKKRKEGEQFYKPDIAVLFHAFVVGLFQEIAGILVALHAEKTDRIFQSEFDRLVVSMQVLHEITESDALRLHLEYLHQLGAYGDDKPGTLEKKYAPPKPSVEKPHRPTPEASRASSRSSSRAPARKEPAGRDESVGNYEAVLGDANDVGVEDPEDMARGDTEDPDLEFKGALTEMEGSNERYATTLNAWLRLTTRHVRACHQIVRLVSKYRLPDLELTVLEAPYLGGAMPPVWQVFQDAFGTQAGKFFEMFFMLTRDKLSEYDDHLNGISNKRLPEGARMLRQLREGYFSGRLHCETFMAALTQDHGPTIESINLGNLSHNLSVSKLSCPTCVHCLDVIRHPEGLSFDYRGGHRKYFPCVIPWWLTPKQVDAVYKRLVADLTETIKEGFETKVPQRKSVDTVSSVATATSIPDRLSMHYSRNNEYWLEGDIDHLDQTEVPLPDFSQVIAYI